MATAHRSYCFPLVEGRTWRSSYQYAHSHRSRILGARIECESVLLSRTAVRLRQASVPRFVCLADFAGGLPLADDVGGPLPRKSGREPYGRSDRRGCRRRGWAVAAAAERRVCEQVERCRPSLTESASFSWPTTTRTAAATALACSATDPIISMSRGGHSCRRSGAVYDGWSRCRSRGPSGAHSGDGRYAIVLPAPSRHTDAWTNVRGARAN